MPVPTPSSGRSTLLACVALLILFAPTAAAQGADLAPPPRDAGEPPGGPDAAEGRAAPRADPRTRFAERLLTLQDGRVMRTDARLVDGVWQLRARSGGEFQHLPAAAVQSDRTLTEVQAELKQRRRPVLKARGGARVPLAAWMLEVGLYTEALAELDRALDESPDDEAVAELLARPDLPLAVPAADLSTPEGLTVLLDYGSRSPPSLQELTLLRLGAAPLAAQRELLPRLGEGLTSPEPVRRAFCARGLRRLFPGTEVPRLTARAVLDRSEDVRRQSALALGDTGDESVIDPLARALQSEHSVVRTHAAEALGLTGFAAAVEPLALRLTTLSPGGGGGSLAPRGTLFVGRQISYVQGFEAEIATNASIADPIIGVIQEGVTLDARVFGVSGGSVGYEYTHETRSIRRALKGLTGLGVTDSNAAWKRWWRTEGAGWMSQALGPERDGGDRPRTAAADGTG